MDGRLELVSFQAGGFRFAVEARHVRAMHGEAPPGAVTAEDQLGLPASDGGQRRWLRLDGCVLGVSEPVQLLALGPADIHPLPPLVAARLWTPPSSALGIRALAFDAAGGMAVVVAVTSGR